MRQAQQAVDIREGADPPRRDDPYVAFREHTLDEFDTRSAECSVPVSGGHQQAAYDRPSHQLAARGKDQAALFLPARHLHLVIPCIEAGDNPALAIALHLPGKKLRILKGSCPQQHPGDPSI